MNDVPYLNIWDWMQRTGNNQNDLVRLTKIRRTTICKILSRSQRCSLENALKLAGVTGVPVEKLFDKPKRAYTSRTGDVSSEQVA